MKIAILSFTSGMIDRGAETLVGELSRRLAKQHQIKVYSSLSLGISDLQKFNWQVLREIDKFGADIIMPTNGGRQSLLIRVYCWLKKKKMVITGMAGLGWCDGWNLLMRPDVFVASLNRNYRWAKKFYGRGVRVEIIPHGVDMNKFKPEGKKREFKLERPIILCVAGSNEYKRVDLTIKAVSQLEKGSLLLVGGNEEWEKMGKELLGKRFKRIQAKYEELPEIYRAADVFSMVSESTEEFGIVYLEALASGLPVVGTDDELRREILGPYGIYVKDVWGEEYLEKLKLASKQKKYQPVKWLEKFSWDKIAKDYISIFSSLRLE
ncbi:MAG: glycosyltransferase family 4 protein [Patescibacteria group bacterium]|nr:glycosyltransferase family 4 protein [Patescibacteria group bacterium]